MPFYKDTKRELYFLDDALYQHLLPDDAIEITDEEANQIQIDKLKESKAQKSARYTAAYKTDIAAIQLNYLSILCTDGDDEETKKAETRQEIIDRKAQYLADIAAIKAGTL